MKIDILTLFPEHVNAMLHESILGRACKKGILDINCVQIRDYTENRQNQVDDYPYGGGFGCVMMAQPLKACLDATVQTAGERRRRVIYLSPQGEPFNQETARRLQRDYDHLILVCGHYEGVDERFLEACVDEEISLGDFVLTGGELAAMAVTDAVCRLVPGVLSDPQCYIGESHWDGLLEYPQYTRPENWEGRAVPEVLLNGDHQKVERWRRMQQLERTRERRPDLYRAFRPSTKEDAAMIRELEHRSRPSEDSGNPRSGAGKPCPFRRGSVAGAVSGGRRLQKRSGLRRELCGLARKRDGSLLYAQYPPGTGIRRNSGRQMERKPGSLHSAPGGGCQRISGQRGFRGNDALCRTADPVVGTPLHPCGCSSKKQTGTEHASGERISVPGEYNRQFRTRA